MVVVITEEEEEEEAESTPLDTPKRAAEKTVEMLGHTLVCVVKVGTTNTDREIETNKQTDPIVRGRLRRDL